MISPPRQELPVCNQVGEWSISKGIAVENIWRIEEFSFDTHVHDLNKIFFLSSHEIWKQHRSRIVKKNATFWLLHISCILPGCFILYTGLFFVLYSTSWTLHACINMFSYQRGQAWYHNRMHLKAKLAHFVLLFGVYLKQFVPLNEWMNK